MVRTLPFESPSTTCSHRVVPKSQRFKREPPCNDHSNSHDSDDSQADSEDATKSKREDSRDQLSDSPPGHKGFSFVQSFKPHNPGKPHDTTQRQQHSSAYRKPQIEALPTPRSKASTSSRSAWHAFFSKRHRHNIKVEPKSPPQRKRPADLIDPHDDDKKHAKPLKKAKNLRKMSTGLAEDSDDEVFGYYAW